MSSELSCWKDDLDLNFCSFSADEKTTIDFLPTAVNPWSPNPFPSLPWSSHFPPLPFWFVYFFHVWKNKVLQKKRLSLRTLISPWTSRQGSQNSRVLFPTPLTPPPLLPFSTLFTGTVNNRKLLIPTFFKTSHLPWLVTFVILLQVTVAATRMYTLTYIVNHMYRNV